MLAPAVEFVLQAARLCECSIALIKSYARIFGKPFDEWIDERIANWQTGLAGLRRACLQRKLGRCESLP
jgi:hypothetical protein